MEATMRFDSLKKLKGEAFRRLTGVQRSTFEAMTALLFATKCKQRAAGGNQHASHRRLAFDDARILA
jgi:hypothetical protein